MDSLIHNDGRETRYCGILEDVRLMSDWNMYDALREGKRKII